MKRFILILVLALAFASGGCERTAQNMYDQPRAKPLSSSPLWPDGRASRPSVTKTRPYAAGLLAAASSAAYVTKDNRPDPLSAWNEPGSAEKACVKPVEDISAQLERGHDRFDIYCAPCHGYAGYGDGIIVRRGFPAPPSFHSDVARAWVDQDIYGAISDGYGRMFPYADRLAPSDRCAVISYVRVLQLSQHVPAARVASGGTP